MSSPSFSQSQRMLWVLNMSQCIPQEWTISLKSVYSFCTCLQRMVVKQMWPTNMYIVSKSCFQYDFIAYKIWPPSANPSAGPRFPNTTREDDAKPKSRAFFKCMCHWNLKELQIKQRWMFSKNQANSLIQLPWGDVVSGHQKKGWPMLTGYINLNLLEGRNRITYLPQDHLIKIHKVTIPSENWFHVSSFSGRTCWTLIYVIFI